jgi:hypothetical protein
MAQTIIYIRMIVAVLSLIKAIRTDGVDNESALVDILARVGDGLNIPELKSSELLAVVPELKQMFVLIRELKQ